MTYFCNPSLTKTKLQSAIIAGVSNFGLMKVSEHIRSTKVCPSAERARQVCNNSDLYGSW